MKEENYVTLDKKQYEKLFVANAEECGELIILRIHREKKVSKAEEDLKGLKNDKIEINGKIKLTKRALKSDKKVLKKVNSNLDIIKGKIMGSLNNPSLYNELLVQNNVKLDNLKRRQNKYQQQIQSETETYDELVSTRKGLISDIKIAKRALRREKRSLKRTNKKLSIRKSVISDLITTYIYEEDRYIDPEDFNPKIYTKKMFE